MLGAEYQDNWLLTCLYMLQKNSRLVSLKIVPPGPIDNTVEPLWKGQECLTTIVNFGTFQCTILDTQCLFYSSWQATSFERPPSRVAFIEVSTVLQRCSGNRLAPNRQQAITWTIYDLGTPNVLIRKCQNYTYGKRAAQECLHELKYYVKIRQI